MPKLNIKSTFAALCIALGGFSAIAAPVTTDASGSGWCNSSNGCNNTNTSVINNHFAGNLGDLYHNWFAFNVPTLGGTVTSATLSIYNNASNNGSSLTALYQVFQSAGFTYGNLVGGTALGSILEIDANAVDNGYVDILLNAAALGLLNSAQGGQFVFGGSNDNGHELFGYNGGTPLARLTLDTSSNTNVPEPGSLALLGLGLVGLAAMRKRKV